MHRTLRAAVAAVLSVPLAACVPALPKFQAGAPVEVEEKALGHAYKQDGEAVELGSLLSGLENVESARDDARSARGWLTGGTVLAAFGGAGLGYGLVAGMDGESSGWAVAGAGAGVSALALVLGHVADGRLERAVRSYNGARSPAPTAFLVPWAGTIRGAQDRCLAAGVTVGF
jgi:hypothetical protein